MGHGEADVCRQDGQGCAACCVSVGACVDGCRGLWAVRGGQGGSNWPQLVYTPRC